MLLLFVFFVMVMFFFDIDILELLIFLLFIFKKEREFIVFNLIFFFDRIILCYVNMRWCMNVIKML